MSKELISAKEKDPFDTTSFTMLVISIRVSIRSSIALISFLMTSSISLKHYLNYVYFFLNIIKLITGFSSSEVSKFSNLVFDGFLQIIYLFFNDPTESRVMSMKWNGYFIRFVKSSKYEYSANSFDKSYKSPIFE